MRLHRIKASKIALFEDIEVNFDDHPVFAIVGDNGTGKSHLMGMVPLAIWDRMPMGKGKNKNFYDVMTWTDQDTQQSSFEVELTHMGHRYLIKHSGRITTKTKKHDAYLYEWNQDSGEWCQPLAGPSIVEFLTKTNEIFGDFDTFMASCMLAQKASGDLIESDRNTRYQVLTEMIGASSILAIGELAKEELKTLNLKIQHLDSELTKLIESQGDVSQLKRKLEEAEQQTTDLRTTRENLKSQLTNVYESAQIAKKRRDTLKMATDRFNLLKGQESEKNTALEEVQRDIQSETELSNKIPILQKQVEQFRQYQQQLVELDKTAAQVQDLDKEINRLTQAKIQLQSEIDRDEQWLQRNQQNIEQLQQTIQQLTQNLYDHQRLTKLEQERQQQFNGLTFKIRTLEEQLLTVQKHATVEGQAPDPQGFCRQCPLVSAFVGAGQRLSQIQNELELLNQQRLQFKDPILVPDDPSQQLQKAQSDLATAQGNLISMEESLQRRRRTLIDTRYELESFQQQRNQIQYNVESHNRIRDEIKGLENTPEMLAYASKVSEVLPRLHKQKESLEKELYGIRLEMETLIEEYGSYLKDGNKELDEEIKKFQQDIDTLNIQLKETSVVLEQKISVVGGLRVQITTAEGLQPRIDELSEQLASDRSRARRLNQLATIYSKKGVIPLLIDQAVPEIQIIADQIMTRLWSNLGRIRIQTSQNGREVCDITLLNFVGKEVPVDHLSGGQQQIVRMVLRLAIGRWRASRFGQIFDMLFFDETFDALDDTNSEVVGALIGEVSNDIPMIGVIAHRDVNALGFPDRLRIYTENGRSKTRWEI